MDQDNSKWLLDLYFLIKEGISKRYFTNLIEISFGILIYYGSVIRDIDEVYKNYIIGILLFIAVLLFVKTKQSIYSNDLQPCIRWHEKIPQTKILDEIKNSRNTVCIIDAWLLRDQALPKKELKQAILNGADVRVLILKNDSKIVNLTPRLERLGFEKSVADGMNNCFTKALANLNEDVKIRVFDDIPPFNLYRIDDRLYLGLYWYHEWSSRGTFIEFSDDGTTLSKDVIKCFEELWDDSKPITL